MKSKKYVVLLDSRVDDETMIEFMSIDDISWWERHEDIFEIVEILDTIDFNVLKHMKMLKHVEKNFKNLINCCHMHENDESYQILYNITKKYEKFVKSHKEMTRKAIKSISMSNSLYNLDDIDIKEI